MTKLKQLIKEGKFSKDWFEGLKAGLKLAASVAKKQGYEISFPEIDELEFEKESEEKPYPAGHCWEGLTPSQVSEAYNKLDKKEKK